MIQVLTDLLTVIKLNYLFIGVSSACREIFSHIVLSLLLFLDFSYSTALSRGFSLSISNLFWNSRPAVRHIMKFVAIHAAKSYLTCPEFNRRHYPNAHKLLLL